MFVTFMILALSGLHIYQFNINKKIQMSNLNLIYLFSKQSPTIRLFYAKLQFQLFYLDSDFKFPLQTSRTKSDIIRFSFCFNYLTRVSNC